MKHDGKCIDVIYGIREGKSEQQSLRYPKDNWTESAARAHCEDRGGTFEAAVKEDKTMKTIRSGTLERFISLERGTVDQEKRTIEMTFSSETPVEQWFGNEILDHGAKSVRLDRLRTGGPLLLDHNSRDQVGVIEKVEIKDRKGRALVRFGKGSRAEEIYQDVLDDIRRNVSVSYRIHHMVLEEEKKNGGSVYRAMDWEPLEISIVSIPADTSVGIGRSPEGETREIRITEKENAMGDEEKREKVTPEPPAPEVPKIDVSAVREEARRAELVRVKEIRAIAESLERHIEGGFGKLADQYIDEGKSADEFRKEAVKQISVKPIETAPGHLGMGRADIQNYSLFRAIDAYLTGDWSRAGLELEASRTLAEKLDKKPNGFLVPLDIPFAPRNNGKRVLTAGTATTGAEMVGTEHLAENFIDALRQTIFVPDLGIQYLPGLVGNVEIPSMGDCTFYHVAEDVDITISTPATSEVSLSPKTVGGAVPISRRFLKQATPAAEGTVRNLLVRGLAVVVENKILQGGGGDEPTGITGATGIGTVTISTPGQPTWANLVEFETDVLTAKGLKGTLVYMTTPAVQGYCKTTEKATGYPVYLMENGQINGYRAIATTNMPANGILFGNFQEVLVGMWGGVDVKPDEAAKAAAAGLIIRVFLDYDVGVTHPAAFSKNA